MGKWVAFDMDNVIFDGRHRNHLAEQKRWKEFFSACINDSFNYPVSDVIRMLDKSGYRLFCTTGRDFSYYAKSVSRMESIGINPELILMRDFSKHGKIKNDELKLRHLREFEEKFPGEEIVLAIDPWATKFWREKGIMTMDVFMPAIKPKEDIHSNDDDDSGS